MDGPTREVTTFSPLLYFATKVRIMSISRSHVSRFLRELVIPTRVMTVRGSLGGQVTPKLWPTPGGIVDMVYY